MAHRKAQEQARLANARITNQDEDEEVVVCKARQEKRSVHEHVRT